MRTRSRKRRALDSDDKDVDEEEDHDAMVAAAEEREESPHEATGRVQFSAALVQLFLFHDDLFHEENPKVWHYITPTDRMMKPAWLHRANLVILAGKQFRTAMLDVLLSDWYLPEADSPLFRRRVIMVRILAPAVTRSGSGRTAATYKHTPLEAVLEDNHPTLFSTIHSQFVTVENEDLGLPDPQMVDYGRVGYHRVGYYWDAFHTSHPYSPGVLRDTSWHSELNEAVPVAEWRHDETVLYIRTITHKACTVRDWWAKQYESMIEPNSTEEKKLKERFQRMKKIKQSREPVQECFPYRPKYNTWTRNLIPD